MSAAPLKRQLFYGRRKIKTTTPKQQERFETLMPLLQFDPDKTLSDWKDKKICLEIGFGSGEHLLKRLKENPETFFIGAEPFLSGTQKILRAAEENPTLQERVRLWIDPVQTLWPKLPKACLSCIYMLFPDPWPKKRHHKRRLFNAETLLQMARTLQKDGHLFLASDDVSYITQMKTLLDNQNALQFQSGIQEKGSSAWPAWPVDWPLTRYAQKAIREGRKLGHFVYQKPRK